MYDQVICFIRPKISIFQFGFLKHRSTLTQLLAFFSLIFDAIDEGNSLYLDIKKAFDSGPHNNLLLKLWEMGITGGLWDWFRAYLLCRSHFVSIEISTCVLPVRSGVPQGSVLCPLLLLSILMMPLCLSQILSCLCLLMTQKLDFVYLVLRTVNFFNRT